MTWIDGGRRVAPVQLDRQAPSLSSSTNSIIGPSLRRRWSFSWPSEKLPEEPRDTSSRRCEERLRAAGAPACSGDHTGEDPSPSPTPAARRRRRAPRRPPGRPAAPDRRRSPRRSRRRPSSSEPPPVRTTPERISLSRPEPLDVLVDRGRAAPRPAAAGCRTSVERGQSFGARPPTIGTSTISSSPTALRRAQPYFFLMRSASRDRRAQHDREVVGEVVAADRDDGRVGDRALLVDGDLGRAAADVDQARCRAPSRPASGPPRRPRTAPGRAGRPRCPPCSCTSRCSASRPRAP